MRLHVPTIDNMEVLSSDVQMALPPPRQTTDLSYEQVAEPHDEQMTGAGVDASLLTARFKVSVSPLSMWAKFF